MLAFATALVACAGEIGTDGAGPVTAQSHLGGCILREPLGSIPSDLYTVTDVRRTEDHPPFTKSLTSRGLTLVARDDVSDDFMRLVGVAIAEIFPRDAALDLAAQEEIIRNHHRYRALIPIPIGEDLSFIDEGSAEWRQAVAANSICDIIMQDVPKGQVMEVVEHILHYVTDIGLHYTFPDEWGIHDTSAVAQAMEKAIELGYYNVEQYGDADDEVLRRVLVQEFAYWVISTAWNLQEPYGPVWEEEWQITDRTDLREKLPELYGVYERTVARVMVAPSLETLRRFGPTRAEEGR